MLSIGKYFHNYQKIISCKTNKHPCLIEEEKKNILQEWNYYNQAFKNKDERVVVDTINEEIYATFNENNIQKFKNILVRVDFLIQYETQVAFKERKKFVEDYENMKRYLFYSIVVILFVSFIVIVFIIFQIIKKDKQLTVLNKKYKIDSITDSMTKLYNRKYFDTIFDNMPFISNANNWKCAFIMVDIDYFKQYNDTYGHDMGDITLKRVASMLKEYFNKKYEFVFRLGGEEFGIITTLDKEKAIEFANLIRSEIENLQIEHKTSEISKYLTISIGIVSKTGVEIINSDTLYKEADDCLYEAKRLGRNSIFIL